MFILNSMIQETSEHNLSHAEDFFEWNEKLLNKFFSVPEPLIF